LKLKSNIKRNINLIKKAIKISQLDLSGLTILTEVGSNYFMYTPLIAALAGAKKVYAWTKDTRFGKASDIVKECQEIITEYNIPDVIEFSKNVKPENQIIEADLVTNLGFIRPIDKKFIELMSPQAAVAYMCEAWEVREGDVDIASLKKRSIPVAGTWENHPNFKIFDGCGHLALKLCMEAGFEVYQNDVLIISNDNFGDVAFDVLKKLSPNSIDKIKIEEVSTIDKSKEYDFVFIADYSTQEELIGEVGAIDLKFLNTNFIIHLCGEIEKEFCNNNGFTLYPDKSGFSKRMTETLAYLGAKPVIDLHTAGLKVGELLFRGEESELMQKI
tara:strand:- start:359 stop:1348 length:990 start_codon:yes stop_codon:yes gene_type:complete